MSASKSKIYLLILVVTLTGCATSGSNDAARVVTTKQFRFDAVELKFEQFSTPELEYHTPDEIEQLLNHLVRQQLEAKNLLSADPAMNELVIAAWYRRRFVGDKTPVPTDSLAYPDYAYRIDLMNGADKLATLEKNKLTFKGGFAMNLKVMAGALRDKKYELEFVEAFANSLVQQVVALHNPQ